jgi:adenylosuccinate lyase
LSNSASGRFVTDYIAGFAAAAARMKKVIDGLAVRRDKMAENLSGLGEGVLAEPTYILLALSGHSDAHEIVRRSTLEADSSGRLLSRVIKEDEPEIWKALSQRFQDILGVDADEFYGNPSSYSGLAAKRAGDLTQKYQVLSRELRNEVTR